MAEVENTPTTVTDSKGRVLTVKEPTFLQEARITRLVGDASVNVGFMVGYCLPAIHVVAIDDDPIPFPSTYLQLEALISRVGREGRNALADYFDKKNKSTEDHEEQVKK